MTMTAASITFEPEAHIYRLPNGQTVPSVTTILRATGVSVDFEAIKASSPRRAGAIEEKRDIGTALHADAHAFDDDDLDWSTVDHRVEPYLRAWETFRNNKGVVPLSRERIVYHPGLHYTGTLDGIFGTGEGKTVLIDIKTGDPEDSGCCYQTAAYELAWRTEHDVHIDERWGVQLIPGRRVPYVITPYTDWRDADRWRAIVTTFYCQAARRRELTRV